MRKKTDQEILEEVKKELMQVFGASTKRGRPTGRTGCVILYKAGGRWYRHRKNAEATGKPVERHTMDCDYLLEAYRDEGFIYTLEDMKQDKFIALMEKASLGG